MAKFIWNGGVFEGSPLYASSIATTVTVIDAETSILAAIWSDRDGLVTKGNPFTLTDVGKIEFYADQGRYNIIASNGPSSQTWNDEIIGAAGSGGGVQSVVGGDGVNVNNADPENPIVNSNFEASSTSASYQLGVINASQWMDITGAGPVDIECPIESTIDLTSKFVHLISNYSPGVVTITAEVGATVIPPAGGTLVIPQNATVGIKKSDSTPNQYIVFGPTQAV